MVASSRRSVLLVLVLLLGPALGRRAALRRPSRGTVSALERLRAGATKSKSRTKLKAAATADAEPSRAPAKKNAIDPSKRGLPAAGLDAALGGADAPAATRADAVLGPARAVRRGAGGVRLLFKTRALARFRERTSSSAACSEGAAPKGYQG